jgi:predicted extracellular nuclease
MMKTRNSAIVAKYLFITVFTLFGSSFSYTQKTQSVAFYNLENFFDTIDGVNDDAEFLPGAKSGWGSDRYKEKIRHINQVFDAMGSPMLIGMCELENKLVLDELNKASSLRKDYGIVHYESPDARGIDVAFLYNTKLLTLHESGKLRFSLPGKEEATSRDIVWAKFSLGSDTLFGMVNHWPSRRGGTEESEPNRIAAAKTARLFIDSVLAIYPNSKIVFMGDLNDHPEDKAPALIDEVLNPMISTSSGGFGGTHNYKDEWGVLDHIFVSPALQGKKGIRAVKDSGRIHSFDFLITEYKGKKVPFRTYAGDKYLGGYSDHLPVSISVSLPRGTSLGPKL